MAHGRDRALVRARNLRDPCGLLADQADPRSHRGRLHGQLGDHPCPCRIDRIRGGRTVCRAPSRRGRRQASHPDSHVVFDRCGCPGADHRNGRLHHLGAWAKPVISEGRARLRAEHCRRRAQLSRFPVRNPAPRSQSDGFRHRSRSAGVSANPTCSGTTFPCASISSASLRRP